ncbi:hypothetical protein [Variovorax sp. YR566]
MTVLHFIHPNDTLTLRKERSAFFTPDDITRFVSNWAFAALKTW